MLFKRPFVLALISMSVSSGVLAWNALGHELVAQIAYDNLTPSAKRLFKQDNLAVNQSHIDKTKSWQKAAVWLDEVQYKKFSRVNDRPSVNWQTKAVSSFERFLQPSGESHLIAFRNLHYVDFPYGQSLNQTIPMNPLNALWGIQRAQEILRSKFSSPLDRGISYRILMHLIGDLHQPLHAITHITPENPQGDKGGNLVKLPNNKLADNLHSYWDKGGGWLYPGHRLSRGAIIKRARRLEKKYPCDLKNTKISPKDWALESFLIAKKEVYGSLPQNFLPTIEYQQRAKMISEERIALAGCRLAAIMIESTDGK